MILQATPISVLEKEIKGYKDFIHIVNTREGIDPTASQGKLDDLVQQCETKIKEFEDAITKLKCYNQTQIVKTRYRIRETLNDFRIEVYTPVINCQWSWKRFNFVVDNDETNMKWMEINNWGEPIHPSFGDHIEPSARTFKTFDKAKDFIEKIKKEKIIVEI